jgi:hypothetical protein
MSSFLDALFRAQPASALLTNTGALVDVSASPPPGANYVLVSVDDQHAIWVPQSSIDAVPKSLYDANTVLAANVDNTPAPITMGASTFLLRGSTGNIKAGTPAEAQAILGISTVSGSSPLYLQPASPHVDDVEFTSTPTGFDCRVNTGGAGAVAAMTLGTSAPNPYARLSQGVGNVVYNTQRASWMHLQSWPTNTSNNPTPAVLCKPLTSPATNMFIWSRLSVLEPFAGYDGAQAFRLCFASDLAGHPDPSLWVGVGLGNYAGTRTYQGVYCPSGGTVGAWTLYPANAGPSLANGATPYEYVGIHKIGTTYHFWLFNDGLQRAHLGSVTLGAFVPTWFGFSWNCDNLSATVPGTPINCADFIRRLDVAAFPF